MTFPRWRQCRSLEINIFGPRISFRPPSFYLRGESSSRIALLRAFECRLMIMNDNRWRGTGWNRTEGCDRLLRNNFIELSCHSSRCLSISPSVRPSFVHAHSYTFRTGTTFHCATEEKGDGSRTCTWLINKAAKSRTHTPTRTHTRTATRTIIPDTGMRPG